MTINDSSGIVSRFMLQKQELCASTSHALGSQLQTMTKEYFSGGVNTFTRILHDVKLNFQFAKLPIKDAAKLVFKKIIRHIICRDE